MSVKAVRWKGWGLCREGFKEKVSFEFRVEKSIGVMDNDSGDDGTDELIDNSVEKSEKKNDQD